MRRIVAAILLCWSCHHDPVWSGIPNPEDALCGSFNTTGEAVCIVGGQAYTCVGNNGGCNPDRIQCAIVAQPPTLIRRKQAEEERQRQQQQQNQ